MESNSPLSRWAESALARRRQEEMEALPVGERLGAIEVLLPAARGSRRTRMLDQTHDMIAAGVPEHLVRQYLTETSTSLPFWLAVATGVLDSDEDVSVLLDVLEERAVELVGSIESSADARGFWSVVCAVVASKPDVQAEAIARGAIIEWRAKGLGAAYPEVDQCVEDLDQSLTGPRDG